MHELAHKYAGMRILLRQNTAQHYLQPDGTWSPRRATARTFPDSVVAYYWALEQELLGVDVLLAFDHEQWDHVVMRT